MSDILITNIDFPKGKEALALEINRHGEVFIFYKDEASGRVAPLKHRESNAVEVPPHGRLGDLDKVADDISLRCEKARANDDKDIADGFMYSAMIVRNAPTVLEASK